MPLTRDHLNEIQARRKGDPDVKTLLLEIRRMRAMLLPTHDFMKLSATHHSIAEGIGEVLKAELDAEPCVVETKNAS